MVSNQELVEIQNLIIQDYSPNKIILFGSYAKGTATEKSDLDLLIISDIEKKIPRWKRGLSLRVKLSQYKIPRDLLFYSTDEVSHWIGVNNSFIDKVLKEGKILYEQI